MIRRIQTYSIAVLLLFAIANNAQAAHYKDFNSQTLAKIETQLWKDYYAKNFTRLARGLVQFFHEQFKLSYTDSVFVSSKAVQAAIAFSSMPLKTKDATYQRKVLPILVTFFTRLEQATGNNWDEVALAKAELHWWVMRRRPGQLHPRKVGKAIANVYALMYGKTNRCFEQAGYLRAKAARLRDRQRRRGQIDWQTINTLLERSYQQLLQGIQGCSPNKSEPQVSVAQRAY